MSSIVILTEAGGSVGFGHLTRCQAIADCINASIYVHPDGEYPDNTKHTKFEWRTQFSQLIEVLPRNSSILIDSYLTKINIYKILSDYFDHVSVIDDYNRIIYPVDLIINPGIRLPDYANQNAKIIGGSEYIILRKEIVNHIRKTGYDDYNNLLITFGGCDAGDIFDWLIPLVNLHQNFRVKIITGNNKKCFSLSDKFNNNSIEWLGQIDAETMADLMYQSDVCISAGGQTLHELAYMGIPTICIETGGDQINNIEGYYGAGFLYKKLFCYSKNISSDIDEQLRMFSDKSKRISMANNGKDMVDGQGVRRISNTLADFQV